ncbi:MAG TPA: hypothetical protein VLF87_02295 [Patescibacteria group bacterium]|nr:hypothetical protein [Patescibacteria group bacterium]
MVKPKSLITDVPVAAEAREALLERLFASQLPHNGELFVPGDDFYGHQSPREQAGHMLVQLCTWLGIKPGYIALEIENSDRDVPASRYRIYIDQSSLINEFVLAAVLAHALCRYLLEERKQIRLPLPDQQAALLTTATVLFGLGLVISNGMVPGHAWLPNGRVKKSTLTTLLPDIPTEQYTHLLKGFLRRYDIPLSVYAFALAPWTAHRLKVPLPHHTTKVVAAAKHRVLMERMKLAGVAWLLFVSLGIGSFVLFQRAKPFSPQFKAANDQVSLLAQLIQTCESQVAYDRQYTDTSDIQSQRVVQAEDNRCQSLHNQYDSAVAHRDSLAH